jgi:hypothetical protein
MLDRHFGTTVAHVEGDTHEFGAVRAGPDLPSAGELAWCDDEGEPA